MLSNHYCPQCSSFNIKRVHRGFIKKRIFLAQPSYECRDCHVKFTKKTLLRNEPKELSHTLATHS